MSSQVVSPHPYREFPAYTRWSRAVAEPQVSDVDPVVKFPFRICRQDRVATAGSCFAQHIARHLSRGGFNYFVTEDGHPIGDERTKLDFNYGTFSARYGNIYTSRQLLQTIQRSLGLFDPVEEPWAIPGGFLDPLRPAIQPDGFRSLVELKADREQHLAQVRRMFEQCDVFVFTMGLTEFWYCKADGTALPVCPGVAGGAFNPERYGFANQTVSDVQADMAEFLRLLRAINPRVRVVLTVSPVPLAATAEDRHVLVSTTYSKSVLRVVAEELSRQSDHVTYFPSYEIITGAYNRGRYFGDDLRAVTEEGVSHVMRLFLQHATNFDGHVERVVEAPRQEEFVSWMKQIVETTCEENLIESSMPK